MKLEMHRLSEADKDLYKAFTDILHATPYYHTKQEIELSQGHLLDTRQNNGDNQIWVIKSDKEIIAHMVVSLGLDYINSFSNIESIFVLQSYRNLGLGTRLYKQAELLSKQNKCRYLDIYISTKDYSTKMFLIKMNAVKRINLYNSIVLYTKDL